MKNRFKHLWVLMYVCCIAAQCNKGSGSSDPEDGKTPPVIPYAAQAWITLADRSVLFAKQPTDIAFSSPQNTRPVIEVDSAQTFQTIDGFGFTLTGGTASLIQHMSESKRTQLLNELFGNEGIGISYLRLSMGASDLSASVFSYNDLPAGSTDPELKNFSLGDDLTDLVPLLKKIIAIRPSMKFLASPWSPPVWMKTNGKSIGGSLKPEFYDSYAQYFVKYIEAMKTHGITIDAVTIQNEPEHGGNNPSMLMTALEQAAFIKGSLGPAFNTAGLDTKIIIWDHNCDHPQYPITVLDDADARQYIDGSAFHLYAGDVSALSTVRAAYPEKNIYFTEQWTSSTGDFGGDLRWHIKNVIIGTMRNWSRIALEWNLANDPSYGPHTEGGCTQCKGAITINNSSDLYSQNVAYYIIAHASKLVVPGSVRLGSTEITSLPNVAFRRPDGKRVLIVLNDGSQTAGFNIRYKGAWAELSLPAGAVGTYCW
ncbi:glucosylceramidase [Niabella terrae]